MTDRSDGLPSPRVVACVLTIDRSDHVFRVRVQLFQIPIASTCTTDVRAQATDCRAAVRLSAVRQDERDTDAHTPVVGHQVAAEQIAQVAAEAQAIAELTLQAATDIRHKHG